MTHAACITVFSLMLCAGQMLARGPSETVPAFAGTWEGESKCTVPDSPCHDEHVIYLIAADKRDEKKFSIDAYKVVNGERQFMGTLPCRYQEEGSVLRCSGNLPMKDNWEFRISGDHIMGTLTIGENKTLYRKISLTKKP